MLHLQSSSFCFEDLFENLFTYKSISSYYFSQCFLYSGCLPDTATFSIYFPNISLRATHLENRKKLMVMMIILLFIISNTFGKSNIHHHHGHHYHLLIYQPPHHYIIIIVTITTIIIVTIIIVVMKISSRYNESDSRQATNHHRSQFLPTLLSHVFGVYHQHHNRPK